MGGGTFSKMGCFRRNLRKSRFYNKILYLRVHRNGDFPEFVFRGTEFRDSGGAGGAILGVRGGKFRPRGGKIGPGGGTRNLADFPTFFYLRDFFGQVCVKITPKNPFLSSPGRPRAPPRGPAGPPAGPPGPPRGPPAPPRGPPRAPRPGPPGAPARAPRALPPAPRPPEELHGPTDFADLPRLFGLPTDPKSDLFKDLPHEELGGSTVIYNQIKETTKRT